MNNKNSYLKRLKYKNLDFESLDTETLRELFEQQANKIGEEIALANEIYEELGVRGEST